MDQAHKLSRLSIALHWLVALTIIALTIVGIYMSRAEAWALYPIHKSIGVLAFLIVVLRIVWRIKNGWPAPASNYPRHEQIFAKLVHWILIIATIAMPVSGMIFSGASGHGFGIFGWTILAPNHAPDKPDQVVPYNELLANTGEFLHETIAYVMIAAIVLHIFGALKHHLIDRDATLLRMLGQSTLNK